MLDVYVGGEGGLIDVFVIWGGLLEKLVCCLSVYCIVVL